MVMATYPDGAAAADDTDRSDAGGSDPNGLVSSSVAMSVAATAFLAPMLVVSGDSLELVLFTFDFTKFQKDSLALPVAVAAVVDNFRNVAEVRRAVVVGEGFLLRTTEPAVVVAVVVVVAALVVRRGKL